MTDAQQLIDDVRAAAQGTAFRVDPTPKGFDLHVDLIDQGWRDALYRRGLRECVTHHVSLDPAKRRMTIEDDLTTVQWSAGAGGMVPTLGASRRRTRGRVYQVGFSKQWTRSAGQPTKVVEQSYDLSAGRDLIRKVSKPLGWKESLPMNAMIGLVVGLGTLGLLAVAGIVLLILWIAGVSSPG